MAQHRKKSRRTLPSLSAILSTVVIIGVLLFLTFFNSSQLIGTSNPTPAPFDAVSTAQQASGAKFVQGLSDSDIDVTDEQVIALDTANRICTSADTTVDTPESVAIIAMILHLSSSDATKFVNYTRGHCGDLP